MNATQPTDDPFDLQRYIRAQAGNYDDALAEIRAGCKTSHWMWYVFPQLAGLGRSSMAARYGIKNIAEAEAYLGHPILGPRLITCCEALLGLENVTAHDIFGMPDELKLRSCATLFAQTTFAQKSADGSIFDRILKKYFAGRGDRKTLELLGVK